MPWAPLPVLGAGAGVSAANQDIENSQNRQADFLATLMMHAQQMQAQREATAAWHQAMIGQREEATRSRQQGTLERTAQAIPGGSILSPDETSQYAPFLPGRLSPIASSLPSTSTTGMTTMPGSAGHGASTGESQVQTQQIPAGPPSGRTLVSPSLGEQEFSQRQGTQQSSAEARVQQMTDQANQAWERLRLQGENVDAHTQLATAAAALAQSKLELERERNANAASKTPQPQFFRDSTGATHAVIFDKGQFKEVPLPKGYTPTKATPPGFFESIKSYFGGGSPASDPTDPNWGKP